MIMKKTFNCDLVIINPGCRKAAYQSLGQDLAAIEPPVWAGLAARHAINKGYSVHIIDSNAEDLSASETAQMVKDLNPLLTAIFVYGQQPSASTQNMPATREICNAIKQLDPSLKTILIGGHVSSLPERTLREESADYVCQGEGIFTLDALLKHLAHSPSAYPTNVPGLWFKDDNGNIAHTASAPLVNNLDQDLGGVAWDLLPMDKYRAHNWHCFGVPSRQPYASMYTTLGCPFNCTFCCINAPFGGPNYRCRSPENVVKEIDLLVNHYGVTNIKFADELFVLKEDRVKKLCNLLIERNYGLNIWAYARVDTINYPGILDVLRDAGIVWLALGIEAGNERVLKDAHKRTSKEAIIKAVDKIHAAGINIIGNYIFGLPEDDLNSMQETLDLAKTLNCAFANFYCAIAYPGSELYDTAIKSAWPLPENWGAYAQHAYDFLPLPTKYITGPEVLKFRDQAFREYFSNPAYLSSLKKRFSDNAVAEVERMMSKDIKRKYLS